MLSCYGRSIGVNYGLCFVSCVYWVELIMMTCWCVQLANLHSDGKQTSVSEGVFQRALQKTYESLVTSDCKVMVMMMCCDLMCT